MKQTKANVVQNEREYLKIEEVSHALTHGLGAALSIVGLILLMIKVSGGGIIASLASVVYGISLVILFSASCAYHSSCAVYGDYKPSRLRDTFMKCDHSLIFVLILGTYTPACAAIGGFVGIAVFFTVASCSLVGIALNVTDVLRFSKISMVLYLVAGWTIILALYPYYKAIGFEGIAFLVIGGIFYTVGVVFYKLKRIPYMHIIWHIFVILGAGAHYVMVYFYCL